MSRICILFGGQSTEHEISLSSAKNIVTALEPSSHELLLIGIDKSGIWRRYKTEGYLKNSDDAKNISLGRSDEVVSVHPGHKEPFRTEEDSLGKIDCVFPILHGTNGEDGTVQGLLRLLDLPFVGCDVLGSAVCMDKDLAKRLLRDVGIRVTDSITVRKSEPSAVSFEDAELTLGTPMFIKPASLGSSVGVKKVENMEEYYSGITEAFKYDEKLLIEEAIEGRELECAVLGNENPVSSLPGEIVSENNFYSYEAKYISQTAATTHIPAEVPADIVHDIQIMAIKAYKALECKGMARVDFFLSKEENLFINEINTIPGFTSISMYPKMWEASGLSYAELLERLIAHAVEAHEKLAALKFSY